MTMTARIAATLLLAVGLHGRSALAQRHAGTWEGTVTTQEGPQPTTVVLDSTAAGWKGSLSAPMFNGQAMPFSSVLVKGDTISLTLPVQNAEAELRGMVAAGTGVFSGQVWFQGNNAGSFTFTRKTVVPAKPPLHH